MIPIIIELIASYTTFPVISVKKIPMAATNIPSNAAESSTITVRMVGSLLSLNSFTSAEKLTSFLVLLYYF